MLVPERQSLIREQLISDGRVLAVELSRTLKVSEDTIRRDLRDLERAGFCRRVYGGALLSAPAAGVFDSRTKDKVEAKKALAERAVSLILPHSVIFIDAGSTNLAIASAVPKNIAVTVATNSPSVALALSYHPLVKILVIGGVFDAERGACVDAAAVREAGAIRTDVCFLGACGVDAEVGVTALNFEESLFKRVIARAARSVAVAATSDKLGTAGPFDIIPPALLTDLVVESNVELSGLANFRSQGTQIHQAV